MILVDPLDLVVRQVAGGGLVTDPHSEDCRLKQRLADVLVVDGHPLTECDHGAATLLNGEVHRQDLDLLQVVDVDDCHGFALGSVVV